MVTAAYLETYEEGEGKGDHHDSPWDHGEKPAADSYPWLRFVGCKFRKITVMVEVRARILLRREREKRGSSKKKSSSSRSNSSSWNSTAKLSSSAPSLVLLFPLSPFLPSSKKPAGQNIDGGRSLVFLVVVLSAFHYAEEYPLKTYHYPCRAELYLRARWPDRNNRPATRMSCLRNNLLRCTVRWQ